VWGTVALFGVAYFRTQVVDHSKYELQSTSNRLRPITRPAPRGLITDRHGNVIAETVPGYTVVLLPTVPCGFSLSGSPRSGGSGPPTSNACCSIPANSYQRLVVLADAAPNCFSQERRLQFPGLVIQTEPKRHYPDSSAVAHLVGIVGEVTDQDLAGRRPTALRQGDLIGKDGLERAYDDTLRGKDGFRYVEVSALGSVVRQGAALELEPEPGATLRTTIDLDLQRYIARIFPARALGAVVALDPRSGEILALYSAPGYNPNAFVGGVSSEYWRELNASDAHPLLDRAIQARYPPGSTWKLAVAAMALKRGIATMRTRMPIPCRGGLQYGDRFFALEPRAALTLERPSPRA
jgi:penicillin-binding protein 2